MNAHGIITLEDLTYHKKVNSLTLFCHAIMCMNSNNLFDLLDGDIDYEDIGKINFILKLKNRFIEHQIMGDTELKLDLDHCLNCNCDQPVCRFVGNNSKSEFALFFDIKENKIVDIYHCHLYGEL
ncbi:hypothetical protein [Gelidibacter sp.]|uniref:hypothetical protein n=1 Tax=Gelidibacter sp. TaxID=2018083 RepID=UPI002CAD730E|nr:hypothetical protein [Gelidibacter sp.]HUH27702.1 hypothetical protein [Gelidibacter sp.]